MHLSNTNKIMAMVFYSGLTFFVGPFITRLFLSEHPDQCVAGFTLGFAISIILWMKFGRHL